MHNDSTPDDDFIRRAIDLVPAKHQWREAAALAADASRSNDLTVHREALQIAAKAIDRIRALVEAAGTRN